MQTSCKLIATLFAASSLVASANTTEPEFEFQLHTGYSNQYVWRGVHMADDLIETGLDFKTEYQSIQITAGLWLGTCDTPYEGGVTNDSYEELNGFVQVGKDLGFVTASTGFIYYYYTGLGEHDNNQEIYFSLDRDLGFAKAKLTYFCTVGTNEISTKFTDGYTELGLTRDIKLSNKMNLNLSSNLGYVVEGGDFTSWTNKVALDIPFAEKAKFSPFVMYSLALGESTNALWEHTNNETVFGANVSVTF